ncbi:MAG TPA: SRPBCC family protein [Mycobacterium sp.]|nr:SRPBCC family protein [Mycobacterium sp.]
MAVLTARDHQSVTGDIPAPPRQVREHYVDLTNIALVHPLVVSVRSVSRDEGPDGYTETWRVQDRIPLGPFTLPTTYTARLHVPDGGPVTAEARQFPAVRLNSVVSFDPVPAGTRLTERIEIIAPRPLLALTVRQAVAAHKEMLAGIRRHFAGG